MDDQTDQLNHENLGKVRKPNYGLEAGPEDAAAEFLLGIQAQGPALSSYHLLTVVSADPYTKQPRYMLLQLPRRSLVRANRYWPTDCSSGPFLAVHSPVQILALHDDTTKLTDEMLDMPPQRDDRGITG